MKAQIRDGYKSPCKGCERREIGCHSECEGYREFKEDIEKIREYREKEHQSYQAMFFSKYFK